MKTYFEYPFYILFIALVFISCEEKDKHPDLATTEVVANSASSVIAKAKISEIGNSPVTDHGFIYNVTTGESSLSSISYANNKISLGKTIDADTFSAQINISNIGYYSESYKCYVRAYITNEIGTVYSNQMGVVLPVPSLSNVSPQFAKAGDTVTITGDNFNEVPAFNEVKFNYTLAEVVKATKTYLKVRVPSGISENYYDSYITINVITGGRTLQLSNRFKLLPSPASFSPSTGTWSTYITVYGTGFYQTSVYLDDYYMSNYNSYSNYISFYVPYNITKKKFKIYLAKGGIKTEVPGGYFTMNSLNSISFNPSTITVGAELTVYGQNFHPNTSNNILFIGSNQITASYVGSSYLRFTIPTSLQAGVYPLSVANSIDTVATSGNLSIIVPALTSLSPTSGAVGTSVVLSGSGFGANTGNITVKFGNYYATILSVTDSQINVKVPSGLTTGTWSVSVTINSYSIPSSLTFNVP
jgi:hypothetical protein